MIDSAGKKKKKKEFFIDDNMHAYFGPLRTPEQQFSLYLSVCVSMNLCACVYIVLIISYTHLLWIASYIKGNYFWSAECQK